MNTHTFVKRFTKHERVQAFAIFMWVPWSLAFCFKISSAFAGVIVPDAPVTKAWEIPVHTMWTATYIWSALLIGAWAMGCVYRFTVMHPPHEE
jgi:hypothetical protein